MPKRSKPEKTDQKRSGNWNLVLPTLGGKQFWSDQMVYGEWRIQKNVLTGHHRLLDHHNIRRAWGSYEKCKEKFNSIRKPNSIKLESRKAVILLHGLGRTRGSMSRLAKRLRQKGYQPINIEYASTRAPIEEHATTLHQILQQLDEVEEFYFVGHSMGNVVWRYYLRAHTNFKTGQQGDPRIRASVMIAPPNQGAYIARVLKPTLLFGLITGKSGNQLAMKDWDKFQRRLATPNHPFAIVAGKYNGNPLFREDNDTTVTVEETKLAGASDFAIFKSMHALIMANSQVIDAVECFLENGYLISEEKRSPLGNPALDTSTIENRDS